MHQILSANRTGTMFDVCERLVPLRADDDDAYGDFPEKYYLFLIKYAKICYNDIWPKNKPFLLLRFFFLSCYMIFMPLAKLAVAL